MLIDWSSLGTDLVTAFGETFLMVGIASVLAIVIGLPLGFLLHVTSRKLFWANRFANVAGNFLVNLVRYKAGERLEPQVDLALGY